MRRLVAFLFASAVAGALVVPLAAPAGAAAGPLEAVQISSDMSAKPTVTFDKPFKLSSSAHSIPVGGTGAVLKKGQAVTFDYVLVDGRTGTEIQSSWGAKPSTLQLDPKQTVKLLVSSLEGEKVGSRVLVGVAPKEKLAAKLGVSTVKKDDTLLFVIDVKDARDVYAKATGEAVAPVAGLPTVKLAKNGKPTITVPKGVAAPTQLVAQPLVKGTGPVVQAGQTVSVNYTGVVWDTGKQFDSSWDRKQPLTTVVGTGSVIAGWDEGLVGQTVGSQVLLVVPPDKGYGATGNAQAGIKGTDTLVFVVDILDAY